MEVAVRSYLAAGVAVVGATSIALAPVQVLPPDFEIRGDRTVAVFEDVSLSTLGVLIAAAQAAPGPIGEAVDSAALAVRAAIIGLSGALENALVAAATEGTDAFQAVLDDLLDGGSVLATAIDNAIANFPTPEVFVSALVDAFAAIDVDLAIAIGDALEVALELGVVLDAGAIGEALAEAGVELAAVFDAALDRLPSPGDFAAAFEAGLQDAISGLITLADATEIAIENFSSALTAAIDAGLAVGETAFEAVIAGLQDAGGPLAAAFEAALDAFPTPEAFVEALVEAFSAIDVDLGAALEVALVVALDVALDAALAAALGPVAGLVDLDASVIADALLGAGAELAAAFDAALADFPTPAQFVAAIEEGIEAFAAGVNAIADATAEAIGTVSSALTAAVQTGIDITSAAFGEFLEALVEGGGTLATAVEAALENLPSPEVFVSALIDVSASLGPVLAELGASLQAGLDAGLDLGTAALEGFAEVGADISAAISASLEGLPTPAEFIESFAEAGAQFGVAADEVTQIGVDAVNNIAEATEAVVEAFRATAESALENGNDALQAIGAGIYAAVTAFAEAASDVNIGVGVGVDVDGGGYVEVDGESSTLATEAVTETTVGMTKVAKTPVAKTPVPENKADLQSQVSQGQVQVQLPDDVDTAGKQVNDGLTETRENLQGAAQQTRENLKGAAEQTRENLKGAAEQTRKNLDGVRKNVESAVGGDKKSADKDDTPAKNTSTSDPKSE